MLETPLRIFGNILCRVGTEIFFLFSHTLSPKTALDAQFSIDDGFLNIRGLNQAHAIATINSNKDHQPNQARLQMDIIRMGRTVILVHTLHGFACRYHTSSDMANHLAIVDSNVLFICYLPRFHSSMHTVPDEPLPE